MPPEYAEDLTYAAENRRRRRLGLSAVAVEPWPTDAFWEAQAMLHGLVLERPQLFTDIDVAAMAKLGLEVADGPGQQARLLERAFALILSARSRGSRVPGEEG